MDATELDMSCEFNFEIPLECLKTVSKASEFYLISKRIFDIVFSLLGILVISPLFLIVSVIIKLTSNGPVIYRHKRIGYHGKPIKVYKFRSMVNNSENLSLYFTQEQRREFERNYKLANDPRVTKIGSFLRKTSIDELPQLFNILKGDMSIVGPRPIVMEELRKYGTHAQEYLSVKPGLTGIWQVNGRSSTTYAERVLFDVNYYQSRSISVDLKLIIQTFSVVLMRKGAF